MKVHLKLFATYRHYLPPGAAESACDVTAQAGARVADVLAQFHVPLEEGPVVLVNGVQAEPDTVLQEGDTVAAFPSIGGG